MALVPKMVAIRRRFALPVYILASQSRVDQMEKISGFCFTPTFICSRVPKITCIEGQYLFGQGLINDIESEGRPRKLANL